MVRQQQPPELEISIIKAHFSWINGLEREKGRSIKLFREDFSNSVILNSAIYVESKQLI